MLAKTNVIHFNGSKLLGCNLDLNRTEMNLTRLIISTQFISDNTALGTACGKFFKVAMMSITDAGDSDILEVKA